MAHPTEAELRSLGDEILDLLVQKTFDEADSLERAWENHGGIDGTTGPRTMMAEVDAYMREVYGFLPDTFASFADPDPAEFASALEQCVSAAAVLNPSISNEQLAGVQDGEVWPNPSHATQMASTYPTTVLERVRAVNTQVAGWRGTAANAFRNEYMNEFEDSLNNHNTAAFTLAIALEANKRIFERVGADIRAIGEATKDALRHVSDKNPSGYVVAFTVVAAVASVVSAGMATPAFAVGFASLAALSGGAAAFVGATARKYEPKVEGATTQEIMNSMMMRISELRQFIWEEEAKIVSCLEAVHDWIQQLRANGQIELALPEAYTDLDGASYEEVKEDFLHT
jgi:hypothetical protein